jgi:hypothetical protein
LRLDSCGTSRGRGTTGQLVLEQVGGLERLRSRSDGFFANGSGVVPAALPEVKPALVVVVTPAAQLDLLHRRLTAEGVGVHVMEIHEPALVAAMAAWADVGATSEVPHPDGALDGGRGVTRPRVLPARPTRLGVSANFFLARSTSNAVRARSRTAASSPEGMAWLSMSFTSRSFSSVSPPIVSCSL